MRVVVLYNEPSEDAAVSERDVLVQLNAVCGAIEHLGHDTLRLGCTLNLADVRRQLLTLRPDLVFNLVESLGGTDRLMTLATTLLDALRLPYTGSPTPAIFQTAGKLPTKERLRAAGLPTPPWLGDVADAGSVGGTTEPVPFPTDGCSTRFLIKTIWEHASLGIGDEAVVECDSSTRLRELVRERSRQLNRPCFAEQFIDGREFNVSLLCGRVLPPAEIDFSALAAGKPRIVGFRAKWDAESSEYHQTPRRFDVPASDRSLLDRLRELSEACWRLFGLRGYARVDFRVDRAGSPWILEVNANPCLAPDAGFAAALERARISYDEAIEQILNAARGT